MLPSWVNDTANLVGIITGLPIIFGWVLGWLGRGIERPPVSQPLQPVRRHRVTLWSLIKTGIFHVVIRPEIPTWRDALEVVVMTTILGGISIFYIWNKSRPIELQVNELLLQLVLVLLCGLWAVVTLFWARLFLKKRLLATKC